MKRYDGKKDHDDVNYDQIEIYSDVKNRNSNVKLVKTNKNNDVINNLEDMISELPNPEADFE